MGKERDWQGLERKLYNGWPLLEAARATGIPDEEAEEWAKENLEDKDFSSLQLRCTAESALKSSFQKLSEIMGAGIREEEIFRINPFHIQQIEESEDLTDEEKEFRKSQLPLVKIKLAHTDLKAAETLAKLALDALKICKTGNVEKLKAKGKEPIQPDIWDSGGYGNWELKDPNEI
jgi:hypothetical protein